MKELKFVINVNPVTKKNHSRIVSFRGRPRLLPSEQYEQYERDCSLFLKYSQDPIDEPINLECHFYMGTKRRVDLTNLLSAVNDVLVKYQVLKDDDSKIVVSMDGSRVFYDKENPRTEVFITEAR